MDATPAVPVVLVIDGEGDIESLYHDDLEIEGSLEVARASHVEFDGSRGKWTVVDARTGVELFQHEHRRVCLAFEVNHFNTLLASGWTPSFDLVSADNTSSVA